MELTGNGLFGKTEIAKQKTRYASAKEIIEIKLIEIQTDCISKSEEYNIVKIAEGMKLAEDITIEKYYNKGTGSIKDGVTENITDLEGIVVSVDEYSEYKFLIGEKCEIEGVLEGEVTDTTKIEEFENIEEFEKKAFISESVTDTIKFSYEKIAIVSNKMQILITIKDEENGLNKIEYPDGDILNCNGKKQIGIDYIIEYGVEYVFKITSNNGYVKEVKIYEENKILSAQLVNKWNLGIQNKDFETHQGTPEYNGMEEGLCLENSVISTKDNYTLNTEYTIIIEVKDLSSNGMGFIVSMGNAGGSIGGRALGILLQPNGLYTAISGAGDASSFAGGTISNDGKWHVLAIKYDGSTFSLFIDGEKRGSSTASALKNSKLYIGGISNSGATEVHYWGYANGYYRNLAIYSGALTDEELENYSF